MQKVIDIKNGITRMPAWRMSQPVDFELLKGENLAIVGPNGGGKSMFVDILIGRHPLLGDNPKYDFSPTDKELVSDNIKYIAFRDTYGGDNDKTYFLQQRWNQTEISEDTTTAGEKLEEAYRLSGEDNEKKRLFRQRIYELFHLESILDKYVILLSSGELRKLMLASSIFASPKVLIIDNPFIGLDAETRDQLKELLRLMAQDGDLQIVLVLSKDDDIPDFISHVVEVKDMIVGNKTTLEQYRSSRQPIPPHVLDADKAKAIIDLPYKQTEYHSEEVINMKDVSIRYGERTILKDLNWLVKNGERWALSAERTERCRQVNATEPCLRRQPTELRLRHFAVRLPTRQWRKHLGHKETHRICFTRNAPRLPSRHQSRQDSGKRTQRQRRSIHGTRRRTAQTLPVLDGHLRRWRQERLQLPTVVERRAAPCAACESLCQRPRTSHSGRATPRSRRPQPPSCQRRYKHILRETQQDDGHGDTLQVRVPGMYKQF